MINPFSYDRFSFFSFKKGLEIHLRTISPFHQHFLVYQWQPSKPILEAVNVKNGANFCTF